MVHEFNVSRSILNFTSIIEATSLEDVISNHFNLLLEWEKLIDRTPFLPLTVEDFQEVLFNAH